MQELSDCGINPFAMQLLYESWDRHKTSPRASLIIPFRDCVVSIEDVDHYRARITTTFASTEG
ncbi:MAG: hypothetical protein R3B90_21840 [Planctomycetaceae bacterium]